VTLQGKAKGVKGTMTSSYVIIVYIFIMCAMILYVNYVFAFSFAIFDPQ
jgi:hypothetical protein